MTSESPTSTRYRRRQLIQRVLLILVPLLIAAVVWDGLRGMVTPPKRSDFTAATLRGKDWSLASYRGKKPVLVSFFATWCGPCKQELPHLVELRDKYRKTGVELVLITREPASVVRQFPEFSQLPITVITDGGKIFDEYQVDGIPHTIMFDRSGQIVFDVEGFSESGLDKLEKQLSTSAAS
jgi:thiol-disulfide isomerase/thioredoxin